MPLADTFLASMLGEPKSGMGGGGGGGAFAVLALVIDARGGSIGTLGVGMCAVELW